MTDCQQLLADYVQTRSEPAFREIVTRYLDLVYTTARRLVDGDEHRARDVAQVVFADLARKAGELSSQVMLGGWLHRHTCFVAANTMRGERRRLAREREAVEMNSLQREAGEDFSRLGPLLDETINRLDEDDRTAILLRFFEQKDFSVVGQLLDSSEDAARMRVNRALDKLRDLLAQRGIHTTAGALGIVISTNAVQATPTGLATTILSAIPLTGTTLATTTTATTAKLIAMTTLQKTLVTATVVVLAAAGIYEIQEARRLRNQNKLLHQQSVQLEQRIRQLLQENEETAGKLAVLRADNERLSQNSGELLKLRGEVGLLRRQADEFDRLRKSDLELQQRDATNSKTLGNLGRSTLIAQVLFTHSNEPRSVGEDLIRTNIAVKVGDAFERAAVDADIRKLYGTGWFKNIQVIESNSSEGVTLNFLLQEKPRLVRVHFTGNSQFDEESLANLVLSKTGQWLDERMLSADAQTIQDMYLKSGFSTATVKYVVRVDEAHGEGDVRFEIRE